MTNISGFKCQSYQEFYEKLKELDKDLENSIVPKEGFSKISEFIEDNETIFLGNQQAALLLDSIGAKVCQGDSKDPLTNTLKKYIERLLPTSPEQVKISLQFFRKTILDGSEQIQSIADWISVMKIPLANLDLSEVELAQLLMRLEPMDLTNYDFEPHNLRLFTKTLLTPELKFKTKDTVALRTIACLCAKQDAIGVAKYIKNFKIVDPSIRFDIATECANRNASMVEFFKNFEITDSSSKITIATLCAKQNVSHTTLHFRNFEIADENIRFQIARLCIGIHRLWGAWNIVRCIKNFDIGDSTLRFEIASLCANENPSTAEFIKDFEIADPQHRIEIARICAKNQCAVGFTLGRLIKNFEIEDPLARAEIAKICAQKNGGETARMIKNFEIEDPDERANVAELCAQQKGYNTAEHFKNFNIASASIRQKIARICVKQNVRSVYYLKNFQIEDPAVRCEIALFCAKSNGLETAKAITSFELSDNDRLKVFYECVKSDLASVFFMENFSPLTEGLIKLPKLIYVLKSKEEKESGRNALFDEMDHLIRKLNYSDECQQILIKTNQEVQKLSPHLQNVMGLWLIASVLTLGSLKIDAVEWMFKSGIWRELALLRDPALRIQFTQGLYALSSDEDKRKYWDHFLSSVPGTEGQKSLMLVVIPFLALHKQGLQEERLIEIASSLAKCKHQKASSLRSVYHIKNMLHTLHDLSSTNYMPGVKKAIFEKIFSSLNEHTIIKNIIAVKGLLQLKDPDWPYSPQELTVLFRNSLEKIIPMQNCKENVSEKYDEIFGSCRNPGGLLTYAAGLKELREPEVMNCLGRYVVSVLDGTFKEERYQTEFNPHLAKIVESNPSLLNTWKEDLSFDLDMLTSSENPTLVINPAEWLEMKLIKDGHLGEIKLPFVNRYLDKDSDKKLIFQELISMQTNLSKKDKEKTQLSKEIEKLKIKLDKSVNLTETQQKLGKLQEEFDNLEKHVSSPLLAQLNLEKACLYFIQKGTGANKNTMIELLMEIDKALKQKHTPFTTSEFANDVKGLIEGFEEELKSKAKEGLKVLFTDNPIDLLLCGTDVGGSCQRLDGTASLNKGLLGYLVDGKNRLLEVKDGDKMIARCLLRLLWDGEKPVIYRERFYPDTIPTNYKTALNALAKKVATQLNVPLTSNDGDVPYGKNLEALGGPAPYEYSDGDGGLGVVKEGRYTLQEAKLIV